MLGPMETATRSFTHRLARRLPVMVRAAFYAITVSAAVLAVLATSAGGPEGEMLMELSWYLVMLSFVAFLLMVLVNVLSAQAVIDDAPRAPTRVDAPPAGLAASAVAFDDSPRPTSDSPRRR